MGYDKNRFINNIYDLAKKQQLKIGELESACGVSIGYLARLRQGENNASPGAEFLMAVADQLSVSVDGLLSVDFTKATDSEVKLLKYMEKLIRETESRKLIWQEDFMAYLDSLSVNPNGTTPHPLYTTVPTGRIESAPSYHSMFHPDITDLNPVGVYGCVFPGGRTLYLVEIWNNGDNPASPEDWTELELVMTGKGILDPVAFAHTNHEKPGIVDETLEHLYSVVKDAAAHPQLTPEACAIIDEYLSKEDVDGSDVE